MKYRVGGTVLSLVLLAGAGAHAQPEGPPPPGPQLFISPAGQPFRAAPGQPQPLDQWWAKADANHDGVLTREEMIADALAFFETLDVARDGAIDGVEVTRYEKEVVPEILQGVRQVMPAGPAGPRRGSPGEGASRVGKGGTGADGRASKRRAPPPPPREGAGRWGLLNDPQPIMSADADWSRRVTREEFEAKAVMMFKQLDRDHDGRLTREELPPLPGQGG